MPQFRYGDETIYYENRAAVAQPTLLFLHSLGLSSAMWLDQLDWFSPHYRCLAPDCRGHGRSTHRGPITRDAIAGDLVALLDHEGVDAAHVVGISMGGIWALRLYELLPQRVRSLVLSDTFASVPDPQESVRVRRERLTQIPMTQFAREYFAEVLKQPPSPDRLAQLTDVLARCDPSVYADTTQAIFTSNAEEMLGSVKVPTLVMVGERDDHTPVGFARHLASSIAGADLRVVPGAGHLSNLDNPDAFNATLGAFLASLKAQAAR